MKINSFLKIVNITTLMCFYYLDSGFQNIEDLSSGLRSGLGTFCRVPYRFSSAGLNLPLEFEDGGFSVVLEAAEFWNSLLQYLNLIKKKKLLFNFK